MFKNIWASLSIFVLFLTACFLSFLIIYLGLDYFKPLGWILTTSADDINKLSVDQKSLILSMIHQGNIISASDLLENFTTYYHSLIAILVSLVILLATFITFNFYRAKEEHDELLKYRLNIFFKNFAKNLQDNGLKDSLNDYEDLQNYLRQRVVFIVKNSDDLENYKYSVEEAAKGILEQVIADTVDEASLNRIYEYCKERKERGE